ncbi:S-layer homology domain-containing protein [Paenibacillus sp. SYP-B3998]|uniref:S-layer homology domain-containing protein n=1 Tax=Paenibacillus sp. SYP-B3998 TaxID=2678564 RepID=A0A6G4A1Y7_9BACL|nr:S-layer homology domain-containing protein [Paenibacillus sp. SYP-B3998]NEW07954.1 S-layer homology domain-containing protein [Paenibacillus sp. SYP-B3998]
MKSKQMTTLAITTLALSMLSSAALGNPASAAGKSSADFTDLTSIDAPLKAKIDAMITAGIFEGVSETSFGITQNMTRAQFAKVATLIFGVTVDQTIKASSFTDVRADDPANGWAIPYIEAAKKAGLIDGVTDMTFVPGDSVTTGQLDTVLLKGLGKKVSVLGSPWYGDAVKQATDLGIHASSKAGDQPANRADLVQSSYTAQGVFKNPNQTLISVGNVQATSDNKKVQVTLNKQVDTSKAILTLNKGTTIVNTTTEWSSDGKSATLTAKDGALAVGEYTVTLSGLEATSIQTATGKLTVSAIDTGNISITGNYDLANVLDSGLIGAATGQDLLATKAEAEDPTRSKLAKEIEVKATSGGETLAIPGIVQSITSSNVSIAKVELTADHHAYVIGNKAGTAEITVMVKIGDGSAKQLKVTVTVKSDSVTAKELKANKATIDRNFSVTNGVYSGNFDAYTEMDLNITDNYGITYKKDEIRSYNFALGTVFLVNDIVGDPNKGAVGSAVVNRDGSVHVTGNVKSFELTAISPNGNKVSSYVTMHRV